MIRAVQLTSGRSFLLRVACCVLLAPLAGMPLRAQVILSEFMADNKTTLADNYSQFSDWIELSNISTTNVNLLNWGLTDNASGSTWLFPSTNLAAGSTLIVFASGRDIRIPGATLHTDFKLSASGEYLALKRPDGTIATEFTPAFPAQIADVSYGYGRGHGNHQPPQYQLGGAGENPPRCLARVHLDGSGF